MVESPDIRPDDGQEDVVAFLSNPETYGGLKVECISTHGAHVFLAGKSAYKLKRAVRFPFMDFSSIAKRKRALSSELHINQATAPKLYKELRAIRVAKDGELSFGGTGAVRDWVLDMQRFDQGLLFDSLVREGRLTLEMMDILANKIVDMHHSANPVKRDEGSIFRRVADDCFTPLRKSELHQQKIENLRSSILIACDRSHDHLNQRAANGFVRRCHGDLHLRNIVLLDGVPTPFDALEFAPELATGDVFYDLAFLLMDLEHRSLRAHSNRILNGYIQETEDYDGLRGLPLFMAVRAVIRSEVLIANAERGYSVNSSHSQVEEAAEYLKLAEQFIRPQAPYLICIGGLSGTGKSSVARYLAQYLPPSPGGLIMRSDVFRKRLLGKKETAKLSSSAYAPEIDRHIYDALRSSAGNALNSGYSVIIDATFSDSEERIEVEKIAERLGVCFKGLWLEASLETRLKRVGERISDASDADKKIVLKQDGYEVGSISWERCDAEGSIRKIGEIIRNIVGIQNQSDLLTEPKKLKFEELL